MTVMSSMSYGLGDLSLNFRHALGLENINLFHSIKVDVKVF